MTISSEVLSGIQTLKGIGKHLEEISRLLHINNGKLFIAVTAFKIIPQNIVPLWPLTVSRNRLSNYWDTCGSPVMKCLCFFVVFLLGYLW